MLQSRSSRIGAPTRSATAFSKASTSTLRLKKIVVRALHAVHAEGNRHLGAAAQHLLNQPEHLPVRAVQSVDIDGSPRNERSRQQGAAFAASSMLI
jgi:hypothetical protein